MSSSGYLKNTVFEQPGKNSPMQTVQMSALERGHRNALWYRHSCAARMFVTELPTFSYEQAFLMERVKAGKTPQ